MNSTLKIVVPLFLLVAVIFGVTYFSQYTPKTETEKEGPGGPGGSNEPPLRFFASTRSWDPPDTYSPELGAPYRGLPLLAPSSDPRKSDDPFKFSVQDRVFPMFFEVGETVHGTTFWFENRHDNKVVMQLKQISCTACSGGRLAAIPPEVTKQLLQMTAVGVLPQGLFTALPAGMVGPGANLSPDRLTWEQHTYREERNPKYSVPAAHDADGWSPQWGILELQFKVTAHGVKDPPLSAKFATQVEGGGPGGENNFVIVYEGVNAFEVGPPRLDIGELTADSSPRKYELVVFSTSRGPGRTGPGEPGDLAPPLVDVHAVSGGGEPGPFVTVSPPERVPRPELPAMTLDLMRQLGRPLRIESAYRVSVRISPKVGDRRMDIGLLEREVWVAVPGGLERRVQVRGMVRGAVWLDNDRTDIDLGAYGSRAGIAGRSVTLITEQRDAEVVLVGREGDAAEFLEVKLEKQQPTADHGQYALKLTIPPNARTGSWSGVIVLEVKGPTPQRVRIPVKGRGQLGG
jgi:hypothetical protein